MTKDFYQLTIAETSQKLRVDPEAGLSSNQITDLKNKFGLNQLPEEKSRSFFYFFFQQFQSPLVYLLLIAVVISLVFREYIDAVVILIALLINALIGSYQEFKAQKILTDLKSLTVPKAKVKRNGLVQTISAKDLVPGDLVILETGYRIPADGRLIKTYLLSVNESVFTGESLPVDKGADSISYPVPVTDQLNMVFLGTTITRGRGEMLVTATGQKTETGLLSQSLELTKRPETPLFKQIDFFSRIVLWLVLAASAFIFLIGLAQNHPQQAFASAVTLAVSVIPEGLPALITITLTLGIHKMAKEKALVQNLAAIDTLGQVTTLIADKTGTLTENRFQVTAVIWPTPAHVKTILASEIGPFAKGMPDLLTASILANDATSQNPKLNLPNISDDPLEISLLEFAEQFHQSRHQLIQHLPRVYELPFDSQFRYMAVFNRYNQKKTKIYVKGAPDTVIDLCCPLNNDLKNPSNQKNNFLSQIEERQKLGEKVIAFASGLIETDIVQKTHWHGPALRSLLQNNLKLVGAIALADPIRPKADQAISSLKQAGLRILMATGDHPAVATSIGQKVGLQGQGIVLNDKSALSNKLLNQSDIYARINPQDKLKLVQFFQKQDAIVAMTGDGVNDAPALKQADIGIAMGQSGTDLAKEAADMILLDDDISTITQAVQSGRVIIANIQRVISYLVATNLSELLVVFIGIVIWGLANRPILPTQILWINLITDGITVLPLAVEPDHDDVMNNPPRQKQSSFLEKRHLRTIILVAITLSVSSLSIFAWQLSQGATLAKAQTLTFTLLVFGQLFNLLNNRSNKLSIFSRCLTKNSLLWLAFSFSLFLQILVLTTPIFQKFLHLAPLGLLEILTVLLLSSFVLWVVEADKFIKAKLRSKN